MPEPSMSLSESGTSLSDTTELLTPKEVADYFLGRIEASKKDKKQRLAEWRQNVELRMGRPSSPSTGGTDVDDSSQSEINPDWSLTKTKTANLFSQVPFVSITHENKQYAAAIPPFAKSLNYEIGEKRANVAVAMEEVLNDVVNAAGIGATHIGYAARFVPKTIPAVEQLKQLPPEVISQLIETDVPEGTVISPEQLQHMLANRQMPVFRVQQVVSDKIFVSRVSPTDLLWPTEFTGSCFDDADWMGHTGRMSWAEARNEFRLKDSDKEKVVGGEDVPAGDNLRTDVEKGALSGAKKVLYDELFYWRHRVDPEEKSFKAIWRIVYVHGLDEPVIHEAWKGQKVDPATYAYVGACKFPIRVLTLTYISDNPAPPSDSSAGRPQVNDMRRSRSQMFMNRERSIPIRGFDVNRVDQLIADQLMRGTFQGIIPFNGNAQNSIWEVARASYPSEDMAFDQAAKADLMELWMIGPNQQGTEQPGRKTAGEANIVQQNFATRIGQERGRVASFFLGNCEVVAGLMALYSEFPILTDQEKQTMRQAWDQKKILHDLVLKIRPDSTIVLDSQTQVERRMRFLNMTVKSGYVNPQPVITEIAELTGLDPSEVVITPQLREEDPNISYRFSGKDDLMNPLVVAMLLLKKQMPSAQMIEQAKQILLLVQQPPGAPANSEAAPAGPEAPDASPPASGALPGSVEAHPEWTLGGRIAKRTRDVRGG